MVSPWGVNKDRVFIAHAWQPERILDLPILKEPYVIMGMNLTAADIDEKAKRLFSSTEQHFLELVRGNPVQIQVPADMNRIWNEDDGENEFNLMYRQVIL